MTAKWMQARQTRYAAFALTYTVIVLAVLAAANWLANRHNKSFDTTSDKRYTLSPQTEKIVKNLKQEITISYYDRTAQFPQARDLLGRYANLGSKLKIEYVDPTRKPQEARQLGIRTVPTILVRSAGKREEARNLTEEELTSALARVLKSGTTTVCFATGAGERSIEEASEAGYSGIKQLLERNNYKTEVLNLLEKPELPADCSIVVVAGPKVDYPQPVVDSLKKHVESGGRAMLMLEPPLDLGKDRIAENAALASLLAGWGVTPQKNQVLDISGVGSLYGLGPEVALASRYGTHPISRDMQRTATAFSIARSLEIKPGDKSNVEMIVSTSPNSFATDQLSGATRKIDPSKGEQKSYPVAAAGTYRTGEAGKEGRLVVVGSAEWASNYILGFGGNRDLFLNAMNWLSNDEELISIRPKDPQDRRLELNNNQMSLIRLISQFLIPLSVIAAGAIVWWRRR